MIDYASTKTIYYFISTDLWCILLQNAPTQSLLSVVNGILDESIERKNGEIPHVSNQI